MGSLQHLVLSKKPKKHPNFQKKTKTIHPSNGVTSTAPKPTHPPTPNKP